MNSPQMWPRDARATTRPIGASAPSTNRDMRIARACSKSEMPQWRDQIALGTKSATHMAANAATYSGASCHRGSRAPPSERTSAGASEYEALKTKIGHWFSGTRPRAKSGASASRYPAATSSGRSRGGSANSIGTVTSCVAKTRPLPTSNVTRETAANASVATIAETGEKALSDGASAAVAIAAARNPPARRYASVRCPSARVALVRACSTSSVVRRSRERSPAATASMPRFSMPRGLFEYLG